MKEIKLTKGKMALVDDEDYEYLNQWKWYYHIQGYAVRDIQKDKKKTSILMHRLIMNTPKDMDTDHINHNKLDNRKVNLRICTASQNMINHIKRSNNTSGMTGVSWFKRDKKWRAVIYFNKKQIHLGYFTDAIDAFNAYNIAVRKYYGELISTNGASQ